MRSVWKSGLWSMECQFLKDVSEVSVMETRRHTQTLLPQCHPCKIVQTILERCAIHGCILQNIARQNDPMLLAETIWIVCPVDDPAVLRRLSQFRIVVSSI